MIGQSSSHTAGAVRIGLVARAVLGTPPQKADIELHGSVAATGKGHATDRALVAGLLGFLPDDERIKDSLAFAADAGLRVSFSSVDLGEEVHPNSARITMESSEGASCRFVGSSTGGGSIRIVDVDGYPTSFGGELETALLWHRDGPGFLAKVTALLACAEGKHRNNPHEPARAGSRSADRD